MDQNTAVKSFVLKLNIETHDKLNKLQAKLAILGKYRNKSQVVDSCIQYIFKNLTEEDLKLWTDAWDEKKTS